MGNYLPLRFDKHNSWPSRLSTLPRFSGSGTKTFVTTTFISTNSSNSLYWIPWIHREPGKLSWIQDPSKTFVRSNALGKRPHVGSSGDHRRLEASVQAWETWFATFGVLRSSRFSLCLCHLLTFIQICRIRAHVCHCSAPHAVFFAIYHVATTSIAMYLSAPRAAFSTFKSLV